MGCGDAAGASTCGEHAMLETCMSAEHVERTRAEVVGADGETGGEASMG